LRTIESMDVQCERCKTEYVFDDALVSARGTTVRCTECGHEFKVRRPDAGDPAADRWVVQKANGQQLTFLTLRELQRAILAKQVARHDMFLLGRAAPRPLGDIAELKPFFDGHSSSRPPPPTPAANADNVRFHTPAPPPVPVRRTQPFGTTAERPTGVGAPGIAAPTPAPPMVAVSPPMAPSEAPMPQAPMAPELPSPLPPPTVPVRRSMPVGDDDLQDPQAAFPPPSSDEGFDIPRRRRVGGWVVAFVLLLAVSVVSWVVAKPYLVAQEGSDAPRLDARARTFLADGEKAMAAGDLESAQEDFDKASALAERDPRVLLNEARVAAAKADIPWLKLRLLPADAAEEARTTKAQLEERLVRARRAADDAIFASPDDPAAARAKIDALRLSGERDAARGYVQKVSGAASQPETAYVLAALDLAEPEPFWTTVIDRLRLAAAGEASAGRARAALVYSLARSGDTAGAKAELAKLDSFSRPYPCLPNLHVLIEKAAPKAAPDHVDAGLVARAEPSAFAAAPPAPPPAAATAGGAQAGPAESQPGADQASSMLAASQAIKRADYARARRIYEALIARNPSDSEALSGIGDVDRSEGNASAAVSAYRRALVVNPSYLPAMLGVADTEWASGDRTNAQRAYKDIADRFPEGTYPAYVKMRSEASAPTTMAPTPGATSLATSMPPTTSAPSATAATKAVDPRDGI
jgi:predicted Zn finger-like uncharacterized protein